MTSGIIRDTALNIKQAEKKRLQLKTANTKLFRCLGFKYNSHGLKILKDSDEIKQSEYKIKIVLII